MMRRNFTSGLDSPIFDDLAWQEQASGHDRLFNREIADKWEHFRPRPEQLSKVVPSDVISDNKKRVALTKEKFLRAELEAGEGQATSGRHLEYCFMEGCQSYDWLGGECHVVPASEYDDYENGVDMVLVFDREGQSPLLLAVDVVSTEKSDIVDNKILRTINDISRGALNNVRYFISDDFPDLAGPQKMPRVVLGVRTEKAKAVYQNFVDMVNGQLKKSELAQLPAADEIKKELLFQLGYFTELAARKFISFIQQHGLDKLNHKERGLLNKLESLAEEVGHINRMSEEIETKQFKDLIDFLQAKEEELRQLDDILADNVYQHLELYLYVAGLKKGSYPETGAVTSEEDPIQSALSIMDKERLARASSFAH